MAVRPRDPDGDGRACLPVARRGMFDVPRSDTMGSLIRWCLEVAERCCLAWDIAAPCGAGRGRGGRGHPTAVSQRADGHVAGIATEPVSRIKREDVAGSSSHAIPMAFTSPEALGHGRFTRDAEEPRSDAENIAC
jgi:hypothetical protein